MEPKIVSVVFQKPTSMEEALRTNGFQSRAIATFDDGVVKEVLAFYSDELSFTEQELIGLTEKEARRLHFEKDRAWLQSS